MTQYMHVEEMKDFRRQMHAESSKGDKKGVTRNYLRAKND